MNFKGDFFLGHPVVDIFLEISCLVQRDKNLRTFAMVSTLDLILYFEFNVLLRAGR